MDTTIVVENHPDAQDAVAYGMRMPERGRRRHRTIEARKGDAVVRVFQTRTNKFHAEHVDSVWGHHGFTFPRVIDACEWAMQMMNTPEIW